MMITLNEAIERAKTDPDAQRRLRLFAADCAARVLPIYEREYPNDNRPRGAIIAARAYVRGKIDVEELKSARNAAWAAQDAGWVAWDAAWAATWVARAAQDAAWVAWAAWAAVEDAARAAQEHARDAERTWQNERLQQWFSDNEPEDWPL